MVQPLMPFKQVGARRVGPHRGGRQQLYFLDEPRRALILATYDGSSEKIDELVQRLHVPRWKVKRWAIALGLARRSPKEPYWTEQEELYLEAHLGRQSLAVIAKTLGRTKTAVQLKAKRPGVNRTKDGYTMRGLCLSLGCDHHKVARWMKEGWLKGTRRQTDRTPAQGGDIWYFKDADIRQFVMNHPLEIDQRRMDWFWMVSLLSGGPAPLMQESRPRRERGDAMYLDVERVLSIDVDAIAGKNLAVLGITQSGKTNTALVVVEEMLSNQIPMTIVDIEGEYRGLKERFPLLLGGPHCDIRLTVETAAELAKDSIEQESSVLLDLSEYVEEEAHDILFNYFTSVWELTTKRKSPYQIILEEAHEWVPEVGGTPLKKLLTRIALRGRKRGLGLMLVSQRSAKVSKDALSQCNVLFLHKVIHPADKQVYKSLVPLPGVEVDRITGDLQVGHAIIVSETQPQVAQIRQHGSKILQPDIKTMLRKRIKELEEQVAEQEQLIKEQADTIAQLSQASPDIELYMEGIQSC